MKDLWTQSHLNKSYPVWVINAVQFSLTEYCLCFAVPYAYLAVHCAYLVVHCTYLTVPYAYLAVPCATLWNLAVFSMTLKKERKKMRIRIVYW